MFHYNKNDDFFRYFISGMDSKMQAELSYIQHSSQQRIPVSNSAVKMAVSRTWI